MFDTTPSLSVVAAEYPDLSTVISWRDAERLQSPWLIHLLVQAATLRDIQTKSVHYRALRQSITLDRKAIDMVCEQMETLTGGYRDDDTLPQSACGAYAPTCQILIADLVRSHSVTSSRYLKLDLLCSDAIIFQKVNWDLETISLADAPEKFGLSELRVAKLLYRRACCIVSILAQDRPDLSQLPSRILSVAFLAFATISQVRILHRLEPGQDNPGSVTWTEVKHSRHVLTSSHQAASVIIRRIESPLHDIANAIEKRDSASPAQLPVINQYPSADFERDAQVIDNPLCLDDIPEDWMTLFGSGILEAPTFWTGQSIGPQSRT